jgi:hypothetical protein
MQALGPKDFHRPVRVVGPEDQSDPVQQLDLDYPAHGILLGGFPLQMRIISQQIQESPQDLALAAPQPEQELRRISRQEDGVGAEHAALVGLIELLLQIVPLHPVLRVTVVNQTSQQGPVIWIVAAKPRRQKACQVRLLFDGQRQRLLFDLCQTHKFALEMTKKA